MNKPLAFLLAMLCLLGAWWQSLSAVSQNAEPNRIYRFPIDAVDPSASANPKGAAFPGFRGENQLILYTRSFGASTQTNEAGLEAVVQQDRIIRTGAGNTEIPATGFVISGHGSAAQWMKRFARPGALAELDMAARQLVIRMTPEVYLQEVDTALRRTESRPPANPEAYRNHLDQARACRQQLGHQADRLPLAEVAASAERCKAEADRAFYNTIDTRPDEFRGAWIRPDSVDPERIRQSIQGLKRSGIRHVFLETYFQGKTAYPSDVMAEYGLPVQHARYKGQDPVKLWLDLGHAEGLKIHFWTQVFFAGNAQENAEQFGPILQKYPQWRNIQRPHIGSPHPVPSDIEPGHYFLDPANPEVQAFLEKLLMEMVSRYDADGLNLDYIRYPASAAANKPHYLNTTWGYTESARKAFQALIDRERQDAEAKRIEALKAAGKPAPPAKPLPPAPDPKDLAVSDPLWPRWVEWRKDQVSRFVKNISEKARAQRPNLLVSAVVFPATDAAYVQKLQDYPRWAQEGSIQALTPIGLSPRPDWLLNQARQLKAQVQDRVPVYVGIFGLYNRNTPVELVSQIDAVHQAGLGGVVLFDWSRINPEYEEALLEGPFRR